MARQNVLPTELNVEPIKSTVSVRSMVYSVLKQAIIELDIYEHAEEIRLDECQLSNALAVSRTPIREALMSLEQEGFVRSVPRRGVFVIRRTKGEIVEMIIVWAALESMAARFAANRATPEEFAELHTFMDKFRNQKRPEHMNEYSAVNIAFHEKIVEIGHCQTIVDMARNLFLHVQCIRKMTIRDEDRAERSVTDHMNIIHALEARDADLAQRLVREHALGLAEHVEKHGDFLDFDHQSRTARIHAAGAGSQRRADSQAILTKILQESSKSATHTWDEHDPRT